MITASLLNKGSAFLISSRTHEREAEKIILSLSVCFIYVYIIYIYVYVLFCMIIKKLYKVSNEYHDLYLYFEMKIYS